MEIGAVRVIDGWEDEKFDTFVALPAGVRMEPGARAVNRTGMIRKTEVYDDIFPGIELA